MAGLGETLQLMQHDHEAEMQIGAGRIDAELDAQRPAQREAAREIGDGFDVLEAVEQRRAR